MKKELLYPRAFVHPNKSGGWSLAWRMHPDTGNHWEGAMYEAPHFPRGSLSQACDTAKARVDHLWDSLMKGDQA